MITSIAQSCQEIDFSKPFIPETMTPLYYSETYHRLSPAARLRYNQLYASSFHEQFMSLEIVLINYLLFPLIRRFSGDELSQKLGTFRQEEMRHTAMFHRLHLKCEPQLYRNRSFYFLRMPGPLRWALREVSKRPVMFPFCLWLTIIEEERTIYYSQLYLKTEGLEPEFVATHRTHLADEVGHVSLDEQLLKRLWPGHRSASRNWNARMFSWVLREYFSVPKRAGWRVILELIYEFPELEPMLPRLREEMRRLNSDSEYLSTLYNRDMVPKTFALLDQWPEFRFLEQMLPGYHLSTPLFA